VDMQEDFCPPHGSLAVAGGRDIAPTINDLLQLPFALKVASKDYHPRDHVSFERPGETRAFESYTTITNPFNASESTQTRVWPVHCVQGTPGSDIIPEIDVSQLDYVVEKGRDKRVEMYSAFADAFGNKFDAASLDLAAKLRERGVTHVYVVGLAGDHCVRWTALDAKHEGFVAYIIKEGTRCVDPGQKGWGATVKEMEESGVDIVSVEGSEVNKVKSLR